MEIGTIIQGIVAAVVGGIILIFTNWITARLNTRNEDRKNARSAYEQFYVLEGLNPLITHFTNLELHLLCQDASKPYLPLSSLEPIPTEAIARTQGLLRDRSLNSLIRKINQYISQNTNSDAELHIAKAARDTITVLEQLRIDVLTMSDFRVKTKGVIPDAFYARERFKEIEDSLTNNTKPIAPSN